MPIALLKLGRVARGGDFCWSPGINRPFGLRGCLSSGAKSQGAGTDKGEPAGRGGAGEGEERRADAKRAHGASQERCRDRFAGQSPMPPGNRSKKCQSAQKSSPGLKPVSETRRMPSPSRRKTDTPGIQPPFAET